MPLRGSNLETPASFAAVSIDLSPQKILTPLKSGAISKFEFQGELHLARVAIAIDPAVRILERARGADVRVGHVANRRVDRPPVGVVEQVIEVGAKDDAGLFSSTEPFGAIR